MDSFSVGTWELTPGYNGYSMSAGMDSSRNFGVFGFGSWTSRNQRYSVNWAHYENTVYSSIHPFAFDYKVANSLFTGIEPLFNPVFRDVEFWAAHLMGGSLDPDAGDGKTVESGIPIEGADEKTRGSISTLWADSEWAINKSVWCRLCAGLGDIGTEAVIDPTRRQVRIRVVDPRTIYDVQQDSSGATKRVEIRDYYADPRVSDPTTLVNDVEYREIVDLDRGRVRYRTFIGEEPYPWYVQGDTFYLDQDFIPFVFHAHNKISSRYPFGWSEMHPGLPKVRKLNDLASRLLGYIGKCIDAPWLFSGLSAEAEIIMSRTTATMGNPNPTLDDIPALYGPADSKAQPLVSTVDIANVLKSIEAIQEDLKDDFPELRKDIESALGDASGTALRVARQRCEAKANARRPAYDAALAKVMKMAIAMGSRVGFEAYRGMPTDPAKIKFRIGDRSVFATDPLDKLELEKEFWMIAESAERSGLPLPGYLKLHGWDDKKIKIVMDARQESMDAGLPVGRATQATPIGEAASKASQTPGGTQPQTPPAQDNQGPPVARSA